MVEPDPSRVAHEEGYAVTPERMHRDAAATGFEVVRIDTFLPEDLIVVRRRRTP